METLQANLQHAFLAQTFPWLLYGYATGLVIHLSQHKEYNKAGEHKAFGFSR